MTAASVVESVPLAHALAGEVARRSGVRALVVKGPAADAHGLRAPRVSSDADVLVPPDGAGSYLRALDACGWRERPTSDAVGPTSAHSVTLIHPEWPCDIDAHVRFPGFLVDPQVVFDELWRRRQPLDVAGRKLDMVDRSGAILIAALHALRTPAQTPRHGDEIRRLVEVVLPQLTRAERDDLVALAAATGAIDTARPVLAHLGVELPPATPHGADRALDAWRARVGGRGESVAQWLIVLEGVGWRRLPGAIVRMLWPTEAEFRRVHPEADPGCGAAIRGRWARIGRGLLAAPRALWGRVLALRGVTDDSLLGKPRS
ncbi:nucleotidyltransferase family protein [Demequina rhizosphaerae]|uniref:nucleotidyltransferase family protein n=1 Tax=Demequina rhizosphaerae TaxID=1638985 RepID=UPI000782A2B1|nr:nucleotidyltransferase family protein [Demequina rhizosphaerae]